ncbi:MAG: DUF86 domain-containing protein, partial [bacterium]|nr:DUF86 domain-containing protein [bacterium]
IAYLEFAYPKIFILRAIDTAKYNFIVAIESAIDISNHIIARKSLGKPEDYSAVFSILGEAEVFSKEVVIRLKQMARFRNMLVHLYWKVDNNRLYEILKGNLDDFAIFEEGIRKFLKDERDSD